MKITFHCCHGCWLDYFRHHHHHHGRHHRQDVVVVAEGTWWFCSSLPSFPPFFTFCKVLSLLVVVYLCPTTGVAFMRHRSMLVVTIVKVKIFSHAWARTTTPCEKEKAAICTHRTVVVRYGIYSPPACDNHTTVQYQIQATNNQNYVLSSLCLE